MFELKDMKIVIGKMTSEKKAFILELGWLNTRETEDLKTHG